MKTSARKTPFFVIDAPTLVLTFALVGPLLLGMGIFATQYSSLRALVGSLQGTGIAFIGSAVAMTLSSLFGKRLVTKRMVHSLRLQGSEEVLDVGCGRGVLLIEAARVLPHGHATGIDLWSTRDQSGNGRDATLSNARSMGVEDRVKIDTGDMRRLSYAANTFDATMSSLAIHNLPNAADRDQAVREIARTLKPGGEVALLDFVHTNAYARILRQCGFIDVRRSWPNLLMFPPVRIVTGRKR